MVPNFCPWATRKYQFFHTNHMLGTEILQVQSTGLPSIFLRAQPCKGSQFRYYSILIYFIVQSWTLEHNNDNTCFLGSFLFLSSGIRQVTVKKPRWELCGWLWQLTFYSHHHPLQFLFLWIQEMNERVWVTNMNLTCYSNNKVAKNKYKSSFCEQKEQ